MGGTKFQWNQPCFNARRYWKALQMKMKILILLNSRAIAINSKSCGNNITHMQVAMNKDTRFDIRARVYVLACGGIEVPRLILYSNRLNSLKIGQKSNAVGKYLSTHPKASVGRLHLKRAVKLDTPMFVDSQIDKMKLRFGLGRSFVS